MAIVDLETVLAIAEKKGCAIPSFNVYNMETVMGVARAATETNSVVIFQVYSRLFSNTEATYLAPIILQAISRMKGKAAFHLDHGSKGEEVLRAIRLGVTGVMYDASTLPLAENIATTSRIVSLCQDVGIGVEGELGHVGTTKDDVMGEYTKVDEAVRFAEETGVSALAVMVGTAHGRYKQKPILEIQRITDIKKATGLPLVLHGGSGVPDDQIRMAIKAGIRKINFGTDLCFAFLDSLFDVDRDIIAIDRVMQEPVESVKRFAVEKIKLLGAENSND